MDEETNAPQGGELPFGLTEQPVTETKAEAFARLAPDRVLKIIERMRSLGKLANRSHYDYSPEDIDAIVTMLGAELDALEGRFRVNSPPSFHLPSTRRRK
jgi:hypothetical protein